MSRLPAHPQVLWLPIFQGEEESFPLPAGQKHCLAIEDGARESTQSWREVFNDIAVSGLYVSGHPDAF
jgi:hypothetical protein